MFARTQRLMLRPGWREDAPALAAAIADLGVGPHRAGAVARFAGDPLDGDLPLLLAFQRTAGAPRLVGGVGLHREAGGEVELTYWIARRFWGLGFATEAARAMMEMAGHALRLPRVVAGHALDNPASGRVLRKLGFQPTGAVRRRYDTARGHHVELPEFALDFRRPAPDLPCLAA